MARTDLDTSVRRLRLLRLTLVAAALVVYVAVQLPMPTPPGPDAGYYLIGCEDLRAGRWPWGSEPPLAFLLLLPFATMLPASAAFVICNSLAGALTLQLLGAAAAWVVPIVRRGREPGCPDPQLQSEVAATWSVALGFCFMSFPFVSGLLKNAWANVFILLALTAALRGRRWRTAGWSAAAFLCHPGVAATWLMAFVLAGLFWSALSWRTADPGPVLTALRPKRLGDALRRHRVLLAILVLVLAVTLPAVLPTFGRYLSSYLVSSPSGDEPRVVFRWYFSGLVVRYLPLWPIAVCGAALVARRSTAGDLAAGSWARLAALSLVAWGPGLAALSAVTGLTSGRFAVQLFVPLVSLAGVFMAMSDRPPDTPARVSVRLAALRVAVVLSLSFGLLLQGWTMVKAVPVMNRQQFEVLRAAGPEFPPGSRLVVATPGMRYWAQLLTGQPALNPVLSPELADGRGPVFVLFQTTGGQHTEEPNWIAPAMEDFRRQGAVIWEREGLALLRGRDDPAALAGWRHPESATEMLSLVDCDLPPGVADGGGHNPGFFDQLAGWIAFPVLGLLYSFCLPVPAAVGVAVPASVLCWLGLACLRRSR